MNRIQWINLYIGAVYHWNKIIEFLNNAGSIHGTYRVNNIVDTENNRISYGAKSCNYCHVFSKWEGCKNCPIATKAEKYACYRTPWIDFSTAINNNDLPSAKKYAVQMRDYILKAKPKQIVDYKIPVY
jgi:hypothetical protein